MSNNTPKKDADSLDRAERMKRACELRLQGLGYTAIAKAMGCAASTAHALVHDAIASIPRDVAEDVKELELSRCDAEFARLDELQTLLSGDADLVIKATTTKLAIMARRAKYLGLDAPDKTELTGKDGAPLVTHDDLLSRIARLAAISATGSGDPKP